MTTSARFSRRQVIVAATLGAGAAAAGLGRSLAFAADEPLAPQPGAGLPFSALDAPTAGLAPAVRLGPEKPPVPEGMLRFPLDPASDCYVLDNFGDCRDGCSRFHEGVDIMGSKGQPVYAVADGLLKQRYTNTGTAGWGWTLVDEDNDVTYRYFHCDEDANGLIEGDRVSEGDVIGYVGKSGTFGVDNYHLHFEVRPGGTAIDPLPLLFIDTDVCDVSEPIKG
jgi:murein DD-endopeptidase MepM/ murein hydrolase activator NlpD